MEKCMECREGTDELLEIKKLILDAIASTELAATKLNEFDDFQAKQLRRISCKLFEIAYDL